MNSKSDRVEIPNSAALCVAFGELGLRVGSRTGEAKRTQDQKEWYVVRRFLREAMLANIIFPPIVISKANPPDPDFKIVHRRPPTAALIEITEATHPDDQREMTEFELSDKPAMLVGELGGRFSGGAGEPGHVWASDILEAIERKSQKSIFTMKGDRHLVIYPNSNASFLIFDEEHERTAFGILREALSTKVAEYGRLANGCAVHVLGKNHVCFDLLGQSHLVRRTPTP